MPKQVEPMKLLQLALRELFLLVAIAAMGCAWWVDRNRLRSAFDSERSMRSELSKDYLQLWKQLRAVIEDHP